MTMKRRTGRIATLACGAAVLPLLMAPSASAASWSSTIRDWVVGNESRHWDDEGSITVTFQGCDPRGLKSVGVRIWEDVSWNPDPKLGLRTFTQCTKPYPDNFSKGTWSGLGSGKYYFKIDSLSGANTLSVYKVYVR
ncbi:hypothetical protein [Streptomyces rimosus]|uniref:hypothetical protein n=1 Tax=Streptomyces rimosus TaxID=1927 RepID=UPI00379CB279